MITYTKGDILKSPVQVITNTVNCVGVMGAGLALQFKNAYPEMFENYKARCERGEVKAGTPYLWSEGNKQILNFPTKRHFKDPSRLEDIEAGLRYLAENHERMDILSLALPPLGCGLGGLQWAKVSELIERYLDPIADLDVFVYESDELERERLSRGGEKRTPRNSDGLAASP